MPGVVYVLLSVSSICSLSAHQELEPNGMAVEQEIKVNCGYGIYY